MPKKKTPTKGNSTTKGLRLTLPILVQTVKIQNDSLGKISIFIVESYVRRQLLLTVPASVASVIRPEMSCTHLCIDIVLSLAKSTPIKYNISNRYSRVRSRVV